MSMRYPYFFDRAPTIWMRDPLAGFLGAAVGGLVEYRYIDAVKLAGHSCPTVAAAWLMTRRALQALYGTAVPERGNIRVELRNRRDEGTTGVVANVAALVTGAAGDTGFKGIGGRFDRRDLLQFGVELPGELRFTRRDTGDAVDASADLRRVAADPDMLPLLQRCAAGTATQAEALRFADLWQARVRRLLLEHADDAAVFAARHVPRAADADLAKPGADVAGAAGAGLAGAAGARLAEAAGARAAAAAGVAQAA